jgi:hypothetical protein
MTTLKPELAATLMALAECCDYSLDAHVPVEFVRKKMPPYLEGEVNKLLRKLRAQQYAQQHPTRGPVTWQLTRLGLNEARSISSSRLV